VTDTEAQQRLKLAVTEAERTWAHYKALPMSQLPETWANVAMARLLDLIHAVLPVIDSQAEEPQ
jgi:hypothetical protein